MLLEMKGLSSHHENIFWNANPKDDLYLGGYVPNKNYDFGPSFDGDVCVVPFSVYEFAIREISGSSWEEKKDVLDRWVQGGGIEGIDRFLSQRDLTASLKKGTHIRLFVDFPNNIKWREEGSFYLPEDSITSMSIID